MSLTKAGKNVLPLVLGVPFYFRGAAPSTHIFSSPALSPSEHNIFWRQYTHWSSVIFIQFITTMHLTLSFPLYFVLLLHAFLPITNAACRCIDPVAQPIDMTDCNMLYNHLYTASWYNVPVVYGRTQRPPGKVTKHLNYRSCQFMIYTHVDYMGSERINLSFYEDRFEDIYSQCLPASTGHTGGGLDQCWNSVKVLCLYRGYTVGG